MLSTGWKHSFSGEMMSDQPLLDVTEPVCFIACMTGKTHWHWLQHFAHSSKHLCLMMNHWKWCYERLLHSLRPQHDCSGMQQKCEESSSDAHVFWGKLPSNDSDEQQCFHFWGVLPDNQQRQGPQHFHVVHQAEKMLPCLMLFIVGAVPWWFEKIKKKEAAS